MSVWLPMDSRGGQKLCESRAFCRAGRPSKKARQVKVPLQKRKIQGRRGK